MTEMIPSCVGPAGSRSGRRYTRDEIAAARRLGLADWEGPKGSREPTGALYWATGDFYPNLVVTLMRDAEILNAAITREWRNIETGDAS